MVLQMGLKVIVVVTKRMYSIELVRLAKESNLLSFI